MVEVGQVDALDPEDPHAPVTRVLGHAAAAAPDLDGRVQQDQVDAAFGRGERRFVFGVEMPGVAQLEDARPSPARHPDGPEVGRAAVPQPARRPSAATGGLEHRAGSVVLLPGQGQDVRRSAGRGRAPMPSFVPAAPARARRPSRPGTAPGRDQRGGLVHELAEPERPGAARGQCVVKSGPCVSAGSARGRRSCPRRSPPARPARRRQAAYAGRRRMSARPRPRKTLTASAAAGKESRGPAADADQSSTSAAESPARAGTPAGRSAVVIRPSPPVTLPPSRPKHFPLGSGGVRRRTPASTRHSHHAIAGPGHGGPSAAGISEVSAHRPVFHSGSLQIHFYPR